MLHETKQSSFESRLNNHETVITQLVQMLATTNRNMRRILKEQETLRRQIQQQNRHSPQ